MGKMIVVGNDLFDEFIRDDGYYVDKTEILYELAAETRNKVTLFTRPRRFGKTLMMSMMFRWQKRQNRKTKSTTGRCWM